MLLPLTSRVEVSSESQAWARLQRFHNCPQRLWKWTSGWRPCGGYMGEVRRQGHDAQRSQPPRFLERMGALVGVVGSTWKTGQRTWPVDASFAKQSTSYCAMHPTAGPAQRIWKQHSVGIRKEGRLFSDSPQSPSTAYVLCFGIQ